MLKFFDALPFKGKKIFSSKNLQELKSNCYIDVFTEQGEVGNPYRCADVFYKELIKCKIQ